jgi:hypothetical protein
MATKAVAPRETGNEIAPLYDRNTFDIGTEDIQLPKLYICQALTKSVQDERAKAGDVIVAAGPEDPDAEVVYSVKNGGEGVLFRVLRLDRGKSISLDASGNPAPNGRLTSWSYNDPAAHPDAWTTYTYTLILPEIDPDMPHKFLLTRSNRQTAKRMNLLLAKAVQHGNLYDVAFRLTTEMKENDNGRWYVAVVRTATSDAGITEAEALADMVNVTPSAPVAAPADAPAI